MNVSTCARCAFTRPYIATICGVPLCPPCMGDFVRWDWDGKRVEPSAESLKFWIGSRNESGLGLRGVEW